MPSQRSSTLKRAIQSVTRFVAPSGPAIAMARNTHKLPAEISVQPTGLRPLDKALDIGGLPCGALTELIGPGVTPISGGTTSISAKIAAKVQRQQEMVSIIDLTHSFDTWQAERSGLVAPQLLLSQPRTLYEAITAIEQAARQAQLVIVVLGVVASLFDNVAPNHLQTLLRRLNRIIRASEPAFLCVPAPPQNTPSPPDTYPPPFPMVELADIRLWVQAESWTHKGNLATAYKANLTVIHNRLGLAGKGADIRIKFEFGDLGDPWLEVED